MPFKGGCFILHVTVSMAENCLSFEKSSRPESRCFEEFTQKQPLLPFKTIKIGAMTPFLSRLEQWQLISRALFKDDKEICRNQYLEAQDNFELFQVSFRGAVACGTFDF